VKFFADQQSETFFSLTRGNAAVKNAVPPPSAKTARWAYENCSDRRNKAPLLNYLSANTQVSPRNGGIVHNSKSLGSSFRRAAIAVLCAALLMSATLAFSAKSQNKALPKAKSQDPALIGSWSGPLDLCPTNGDNNCAIGANFALMHTGKILFYYFPRPGSGPGSRSVVLDPVTGVVDDTLLTASRDIFCSGITIAPDGRVIVTGGDAPHAQNNHSGTWNTTIFDPITQTWSLGADMNFARWYPTSIELADGTQLELSGPNETGTKIQNVLETYNVTTNVWTVLPATANMPAQTLDGTAYPRVTLMTSGKVFLSAPAAKSYIFDPVANTWKAGASTNFGKRYYAPHVLLPDLKTLLVSGGSPVSQNGTGTTTATAETIDLSQKIPVWQYTPNPMNISRMNHNLVLLADGTVLAIGGGQGGGRFSNPVLTPELYDPATGSWSLMADQGVNRTYHSTAGLLPDGRVLSAGADTKLAGQQSYEIYSPPYLFKGARPTITVAPTSVTYGQPFNITTPDAASITRVAMIKATATTHANNMDQRYVDLAFTVGNGVISTKSPASGKMAPPGYYLLVIVNSSGVPSVMPFIQIQ